MSDHDDEAAALVCFKACDKIVAATIERWGADNDGPAWENGAAIANLTLAALKRATGDARESLARAAIVAAVTQLVEANLGAEWDDDSFNEVLRRSGYWLP